MRKSFPFRILCLWISCLLLIGNLCNAPVLPKSMKGSYPCEGHGCGCKNAEDCLRHCCCRSHTSLKGEPHEHAMAGAQHAVSQLKHSFLRSLACLGYPYKFSPSPNLVFISQGVYVLPGETPRGFTKESTFPVPIQGYTPPLEKPPRPLARAM